MEGVQKVSSKLGAGCNFTVGGLVEKFAFSFSLSQHNVCCWQTVVLWKHAFNSGYAQKWQWCTFWNSTASWRQPFCCLFGDDMEHFKATQQHGL